MYKDKSKRNPAAVSSDLAIGISTLVLCCFLLSGLTGIIYEILWTRMIVKVIGSAPFAVSIILTVFMGGLGLGSFLASRMIDRVEELKRLLRLYALLELAIGGYGVILPVFMIAFKPLYSVLYNQLFNYFLFYNFLTLTGCVILLIIPVICMGATLPILCRFYVVQLDHLGTRAGRLYALNTIGAAGGSLLCGFWLINLCGVWGTLLFAMLLNGLIGGVCLFASYRVKTWPKNKDSSAQSSTSPPKAKNISTMVTLSYSSGDAVGALVIFAISGFCAMAYEVIWTRLLGLIIGPTTYSFTIVLATFILGLALGSLIFGWLSDKIKNLLRLLIFTQLIAAFMALVISQLLGNSQFFFAKLIYQFKDHFAQLAMIKAGILFFFMLGPTLCLGATFPLVGKIYTESLARVGRSIGFAYAINTFGAVLGAFCAGFLLIPWFGKEQSLSLVIGVQFFTSLVIGGYLLWKKKAHIVSWIPLGGTALLVLILCFQFPYWNRQLLSMGRYHRFEDFSSELESSSWLETLFLGPKMLEKYQSNSELLYYGDGVGGFTTVLKNMSALGTTHYCLVNSGKPDASSRGDMSTQTLLAHIPLLFHPNPKEVMVLGLASGITAGEVLHYPIERLDIIEISEQVVSASDFFIPWNNKVLSNPKTRLIIQDGRAHLELTKEKYDVIISEPSNPWMAGLANLFTKDFFLSAKNRLNEDGIFVQFFHSYQMGWPTFDLVGRTFFRVFPNSLLMTTSIGGSDCLMIGFKGENRMILNNAYKRISYARQSKNITLPDPRLLYRLVVSEDLQKLFGQGLVHSDNWPRLEFAAPKQMYTDDPIIAKNIRSKRWLSQETRTILREIANVEGQIDFAAFALSVFKPFHNMVDLSKATPDQKRRFFKIMEDYCTRSLIEDYSIFTDQELKERCLSTQIETIQNNIHLMSDKTVAYKHLGNVYNANGEFQLAVESYQKSLAINPNDPKTYNDLGVVLNRQGKPDVGIKYLKKAIAINPNFAESYINLGNAYDNKGMLDDASNHFQEALRIKPDFAEAYNKLGIILRKQGSTAEAINYYKEALRIKPDHLSAQYNLGIALATQGRTSEATSCFQEAIRIKPDFAEAHSTLGVVLARDGRTAEAISHIKEALRIKPGNVKARSDLEKLLELQRKTQRQTGIAGPD